MQLKRPQDISPEVFLLAHNIAQVPKKMFTLSKWQASKLKTHLELPYSVMNRFEAAREPYHKSWRL